MVAAAVLLCAVTLSVLTRRGTVSPSSVPPLLGIAEIVFFQLLVAVFYCDFAFPALVCLIAFIASFGPHGVLVDYRYTVSLAGAVAGAVYTALDLWWRHVAAHLSASAASSPELRQGRRALFEIGWRYLAAWLVVLVVDALAPLLGHQFQETEHVIAEAGGVIILIDLIALGATRFGEARRALQKASLVDLHRGRPRPHPASRRQHC